MRATRLLFSIFSLSLLFQPLYADLKYQQTVTLSSCSSKEECKEIAREFLRAAKDDPNIHVINVRYSQEPFKDGGAMYHAMINCYVSQMNTDILRVQEKIAQANKDKYVGRGELHPLQ